MKLPGGAGVAPANPAAGTAANAARPPTWLMTIGKATRKPPSRTTNWTAFTQAEPSSPPAMKYTVITTALAIVPSHRGMPATTVSTAAPAMSCPARIDSVPSQMSDATTPRTVRPYLSSR